MHAPIALLGLCLTAAFLSPPPAQPGPAAGRAETNGIPRNPGASFSEDPALDAALERALVRALAEVRAETERPQHLSAADLERNAFFHRRLARLVAAVDAPTPTLLKGHPVGEDRALLTLAFGAERDGQFALDAIVELEARPSGDTFVFACPFERNTRHLERTRIAGTTFVHLSPLEEDAARGFAGFRNAFALEAGAEAEPLTYFCFPSLDALLRAYGLVFDRRRCNFLEHDLGFLDDGGRRFATGTDDPDRRFEFVRETLGVAPGAETLYGPFATGLAVCVSDCYGLSGDGLETLKAQFREELARRPDIDFAEEFRKERGASIHRHFTHFVICAFTAERVIDAHGIAAAIELARSGPDRATFFRKLDALVGVDEAGLHAAVLEAIAD
ncbi:MAG: hypothetical protein AAFP22_02810 [Planctomycetota bacterium]